MENETPQPQEDLLIQREIIKGVKKKLCVELQDT